MLAASPFFAAETVAFRRSVLLHQLETLDLLQENLFEARLTSQLKSFMVETLNLMVEMKFHFFSFSSPLLHGRSAHGRAWEGEVWSSINCYEPKCSKGYDCSHKLFKELTCARSLPLFCCRDCGFQTKRFASPVRDIRSPTGESFWSSAYQPAKKFHGRNLESHGRDEISFLFLLFHGPQKNLALGRADKVVLRQHLGHLWGGLEGREKTETVIDVKSSDPGRFPAPS